MTDLSRMFTEHPESVGETYTQHARHAFWFSGRLAIAAMACAVHAVFPSLCTRTGGTIIRELHDKMVVNRTGDWRADAQAGGAIQSGIAD